MANSTQVSITKTEKEWEVIKSVLAPDGEKFLQKISLHIRKSVLKIKADMDKLPDSKEYDITGPVVKRPYVDNAILADIKLISVKTGIPESVIINRIIITPLLQSQP